MMRNTSKPQESAVTHASPYCPAGNSLSRNKSVSYHCPENGVYSQPHSLSQQQPTRMDQGLPSSSARTWQQLRDNPEHAQQAAWKMVKLEPLDRRDGYDAIAYSPLIEFAGALVCSMIFQRCELRTLPSAPVFCRSQQPPADALTLVPTAYRDLRNVAVDHFPVHCIRGPVELGVNEPNNLTIELRDKGNAPLTEPRRMLPALAVAC